MRNSILLLLLTLLLVTPVTSCKNFFNSQQEENILTIYSGRKESLVGPIIKQFSDTTGINTQIKYGGTSELAATIIEEGNKTPADIFFSQDPAGLGALEDKFQVLPDKIFIAVNEKFKPENKKWVGLSGRARAVVYNTDKHTAEDLPKDIFEYRKPEWKNKIGWAPTNGSFQAMVTAMRKVWGEEKTKEWLIGIKNNNPKAFPNNTTTVKGVANGEVEVGFVNHYYLYRIMEEQGLEYKARNHNTDTVGPENLVMVAGVGLLENSKNKENALKFIEFMLSPVSQQYFASQNYEYPVVDGVKMNPIVAPLDQINTPEIKISEMNDLKGTVELLREVQIIP